MFQGSKKTPHKLSFEAAATAWVRLQKQKKENSKVVHAA